MRFLIALFHLFLLLFFLVVLQSMIQGCGYKPSSHYAQKVIGEKVYTEVEVSLSDPENAVLTKDALNKALYTRLKTVVTRSKHADSKIKVAYENIHFIPLQFDANGYVVYYQAHITLRFHFEKGDTKEDRRIVGRYEFPILPSAIISNDVRLKAIEKGSLKALDQFIAYIATKGLFLDSK